MTRRDPRHEEVTMKVGLIPVNIGVKNVERMVGLAVHAEKVGFESVWTFEHVMVPVDYASRYPYSADGKMGATPETNFVDPLIALAAIAASTRRVRLGTGVNILPQTNPLYLAKQAASLDFVSGGRLMLGLGVGWLEEEFAALGVPFARRGERADDYLAALRKVWSGDVVEHESEFLHWHGFKSHPLPVQSPLPIVIGGSKGRAFERIARFGDGWYAPTATIDQLASLLPKLDAACAKVGRDRATIEISAMWIPAMEDASVVARYAELGVARLLVPLPALAMGGDPIEGMSRFADEVLAKLGGKKPAAEA
jgi:probable F420-dependent oxidoreductase